MADERNNKILEVIAIAIIAFLLWRFLNQRKKVDIQTEEPATTAPEFSNIGKAETCEHIVYKPLSPWGPFPSKLLGGGWCYRGDGSWFDGKKVAYGDPYADEQARLYTEAKQAEAIRDINRDVIQFRLINTTLKKQTVGVLNSTQSPGSFNGTFDGGGNPTPSVVSIYLETTKSGLFSLTLDGSGPIQIDWGDGTIDSHTLSPGTYPTYTHTYSAGGTISITGYTNITYIQASGQSVTKAIIPELAVGIQIIDFSNNAISVFDTYAAWVNLQQFNVQTNNLSAITLRPEWVNIQIIAVSGNHLSALDTYAAWVNLLSLTAGINSIASVNTFASWVNLSVLDFSENQLTSIILRPEWVNITAINIHDNHSLVSIGNTYAAWTQLQTIELTNCPIGLITTFSSWVQFYRIGVFNTGLSTFAAHHEWGTSTNIQIDARDNAIISAAAINSILTEIDASIKTTGFIYLEGGTNAAPTGAGIIAKNSLILKGINVTTN